MKRPVLTLAGLSAFIFGCCGVLAAAAQGPALATVPHHPDSGNLLIHCGQLIDGRSDHAHQSRWVLIENGRFSSVGRSRPPEAEVPVLRQLAPGVTLDAIQKVTEPKLIVAPDMKEMTLS